MHSSICNVQSFIATVTGGSSRRVSVSLIDCSGFMILSSGTAVSMVAVLLQIVVYSLLSLVAEGLSKWEKVGLVIFEIPF